MREYLRNQNLMNSLTINHIYFATHFKVKIFCDFDNNVFSLTWVRRYLLALGSLRISQRISVYIFTKNSKHKTRAVETLLGA